MFGPEISTSELKKNLDAGLGEDAILVDVRTPEEFEEGYINCAVNIPMDQLGANLDMLKNYNKVYLYCRSGSRSSFSSMQLQGVGVKAINVSGGTLSWMSQGHQLAN